MTDYYRNAGWAEAKRLRRKCRRARWIAFALLILISVMYIAGVFQIIEIRRLERAALEQAGVRHGRAVLVNLGSAHRGPGTRTAPRTDNPFAPASTPNLPASETIRVSPAGSIYQQALDYIDFREGDYGTNPKCARGIIGPAGERGRFQITPIFIEDVLRLFGRRIDPYDRRQCQKYILLYLRHYRPEATSVEALYRCYNAGPTGAKR